MVKFRAGFLSLLAMLAFSAQAALVEYRFSGVLTGDSPIIFSPKSVVGAPFHVSIFGDTDDVFSIGAAGIGPGFANNSVNATWTVDGFGTAVSNNVQVYSFSSIGTVGFGWDGQVFPVNTDPRAQTILSFSGNAIAMDPDYSRLSAPVDVAPVVLRTDLRNPPDVLPEYTTWIYFEGDSPLLLKELTNVSYSVLPVPVPLPTSYAMFMISVGGILAMSRKHKV